MVNVAAIYETLDEASVPRTRWRSSRPRSGRATTGCTSTSSARRAGKPSGRHTPGETWDGLTAINAALQPLQPLPAQPETSHPRRGGGGLVAGSLAAGAGPVAVEAVRIAPLMTTGACQRPDVRAVQIARDRQARAVAGHACGPGRLGAAGQSLPGCLEASPVRSSWVQHAPQASLPGLRGARGRQQPIGAAAAIAVEEPDARGTAADEDDVEVPPPFEDVAELASIAVDVVEHRIALETDPRACRQSVPRRQSPARRSTPRCSRVRRSGRGGSGGRPPFQRVAVDHARNPGEAEPRLRLWLGGRRRRRRPYRGPRVGRRRLHRSPSSVAPPLRPHHRCRRQAPPQP